MRPCTGSLPIVLVSPAVPAQEIDVIDSAARAGVGHVVKITSQASADSPIARQRGQAEIEAAVLASGWATPFCATTSTWRTSSCWPLRSRRRTPSVPRPATAKLGSIDTSDVAAVAAEIATAPAGHVGTTYLLTGPQLLSHADVAATLSKVLARPIVFQKRTRDRDKKEMIDAGLPAAFAEMNAHVVSPIAEGDAAWLSQDARTVTGRPARSFEQFATDHSAFTLGG